MADESVVLDVLIELKQEGLEMIRVMSGQLSELNDKVRDVNQSLERMSDRLHADALAFLELGGAATVARGATGGGGLLGFLGPLAQMMPGGTVMGYAILGVVALSTALFPLALAFGAVVANTIAWTAIATVAISAIGGLAGAIFMLGAANAGGLSPATEMVKTHHALVSAIKEHQKALDELAAAKAGEDVYGLGKGSRGENVRIASGYVNATGRNLADAQHDIREPLSGLGGPIDKLGAGIDDLVHHFEAASRPMADAIATWLLPLGVGIERAGDAILKWFGQRLPQIFAAASDALRNLSGFFASIFTTVGKTVDYFLAHRAEVDAFWKGFLGGVAAAFDGFMNAMTNIADWFRNNWPAIAKNAGLVAGALRDGFAVFAREMQLYWPVITAQITDIGKHLKDLTPLWYALGAIVGLIATGIEGVLIPILGIIQAIEQGLHSIQNLGNTLKNGPWFAPNVRTNPNALQLSTPANSQMTGSPGEHGRSGLNVLPMAFVTMPPSREQVSIMREAIRRLDRAQT